MTSTYTPMPTLTAPKVGPCDCGCSDCHGDCCALECPTKPNFFCGQVLTDEDLKALVDWTSAKSALQRFRHGWGVSCGLEVTCGHDPKNPARVVAEPGYAIDCCGHDIVVCEPIYYDFKCDKPFDPCCPEPRGSEKRTDVTGNPDNKLACIPQEELRAFDLCLKFAEKQTGGRRALARGNCKPLDECQFTRVIETGSLTAREVLDPCVPPARVVEKKYREELDAFLTELDKYRESPERLLEWVRKKQLHSFCFVEDCLCLKPKPVEVSGTKKDRRRGLSEQAAQRLSERVVDSTVIAELIFYIVQDWRNYYFQCLCKTCEDDTCEGGVPLARVWLWNKTEDNCKICKVAQIDAYPPYRRLLGRDCRPSHPDCIDLSRYIWSDLADVRDDLCKNGFTVGEVVPFAAAETITILRQIANDFICAPFGSKLLVRYYKDVCGRERVVCFGAQLT